MTADPATDDFSIRTRMLGDILLIQLKGPLAGTSVDIARMYVGSALTTHLPSKVITDISGLTLLEQAGLETLRSAARQARKAGGRMIITGGCRLLDATGDGLDLAPTVSDAFQELHGSGETSSAG